MTEVNTIVNTYESNLCTLETIDKIVEDLFIDEVMKLYSYDERIFALMFYRVFLQVNASEDEAKQYTSDIISTINQYSRIVRTANFYGICIKRVLDLSRENMNKLVKNISIETLNSIFSEGNSCETQKYISDEIDKKEMEMKCTVCKGNKAEVMKTYLGEFISCTNCFCPIIQNYCDR